MAEETPDPVCAAFSCVGYRVAEPATMPAEGDLAQDETVDLVRAGLLLPGVRILGCASHPGRIRGEAAAPDVEDRFVVDQLADAVSTQTETLIVRGP